MGDGFRRMVINSQERAISPDINRLQTFVHQDLAEMFRHFLNVGVTNEDDALGTTNAPSTLGTPLRAEIFGNGFLVKPQAGTFDILVDPGVMLAIVPDAAADESNYKYLRDSGVPLAGTLAITANASGSTRIDVIECSRNATDALVTDSRDIFNEVTGLFTATTVTKEQSGRLTYRVRAGTPGAGMPANQAGWLPLCVASVPNGAADNDDVTFWDVRPLVYDRLLTLPRTQPRLLDAVVTFDQMTDPAKVTARGFVEVIDRNGRKLGGMLRRGTPGTDADSIDVKLAANQAGTFAADGMSYLYLATPFGLPRWARYTDGPSGRVPRAPNGILVLSDIAPQHLRPLPSAAVTIPTSTGLVGTTTDAVCIACLPIGGGAAGEFYGGIITRVRHMMTGGAGANANLTQVAATSLGAGSNFYWDLVAGTHFPTNARALIAHVKASWGAAGSLLGPRLLVSAAAAATPLIHGERLHRLMANAQEWEEILRIPIVSDTYPATAGQSIRAAIDYGGTLTTPTSAFMTIEGWEF